MTQHKDLRKFVAHLVGLAIGLKKLREEKMPHRRTIRLPKTLITNATQSPERRWDARGR